MGLLNATGIMRGAAPMRGIGSPRIDPTMMRGTGPMDNGFPEKPPVAPQMPQAGGLMGAFGGNPMFQQQLQGLMQGQGPGMGPPVYNPPATPINATAPPVDPRHDGIPGNAGGRGGQDFMGPGGGLLGGGQMAQMDHPTMMRMMNNPAASGVVPPGPGRLFDFRYGGMNRPYRA